MKIQILILNWNGKKDTINCIKSILKSNFSYFKIHLLDNGSKENELKEIKSYFDEYNFIKFYQSQKNLGFAGGNNLLLKEVIPSAADNDIILFLNNDTEIPAVFLDKISTAVNYDTKEEMVAVRMMKLDEPKKVDNLGVKLFKSGLGANRITTNEKLFCPSGGCALFSINCLKAIYEKTGKYFDDLYFCYAEDIDLAWRGLLLGFKVKYVDDAVCYHKGGASSGGSFNKFVMFHTLRNSLFNLVKNMPAGIFLRHSYLIIGLQIALFFRYLFTGKFLTLLKADLSFLRYLPVMIKKRSRIKRNRVLQGNELKSYFSNGIY